MPLPAEFTTQIARLQEVARVVARAAILPGLVQRMWATPAGLTGDPQIPSFLITAIARYDLNSLYHDVITGVAPSGGKMAELRAYKLAIDYLAALERAQHARHASAVRCHQWAAARRAGHADATYGIFAAIQNDLTALLGAVS